VLLGYLFPSRRSETDVGSGLENQARHHLYLIGRFASEVPVKVDRQQGAGIFPIFNYTRASFRSWGCKAGLTPSWLCQVHPAAFWEGNVNCRICDRDHITEHLEERYYDGKDVGNTVVKLYLGTPPNLALISLALERSR
jgi:hypothetical protein